MSTDPWAQVTELIYDDRKQVTELVLPNGGRMKLGYGHLHRVVWREEDGTRLSFEYVGITNNPSTRRAQHTASGRFGDGYTLAVVEDNLTYARARGYEQADIAHYGTRDTSRVGEPMQAGEPNRVWSYDPARADERALAFQQHERARAAAHGGCG